ncbi:MAG: DUF559 domain-containing protein [Clostridia bacterium]|nr:DUF559 domain-containing protein [Clostridia bacterium]
MSYQHNQNRRAVSQQLRREMTPEEKHIYYDFLWRLPFTVKRQEQFGDYHTDFFIEKYKLVIEIDGRQHGLPDHVEHDEKRTRFLESCGVNVVRYSNEDIRNRFDGVCNDLLTRFEVTYDQLKPPRKSSKVYKYSD